MSKSNNKMKQTNNQPTRRRRVRRAANQRSVDAGVIGMPVAWPGSSAVTPGRAHVRMVTEVFNSVDSRPFSKSGFETWSSQLAGLLSPYKYFRICDVAVEVIVSGGAASPYSVAFNVSNGYTGDTDMNGVLNDDYSAVATAMIRPKLHPPKAYWAGRPVNWNTYSKSGDPNYDGVFAHAGAISLAGTGGTAATDKIGYLIADIVVEFHTLL